eukprot:g14887.t1
MKDMKEMTAPVVQKDCQHVVAMEEAFEGCGCSASTTNPMPSCCGTRLSLLQTDAVEDKRQNVNVLLGEVLMKASLAGMIGVTVLCLVRTQGFTEDEMDKLADVRVVDEEYEWLRFKEDSPLVLYLATVEMLICGSCAVTAAAMYQRRGSEPKGGKSQPASPEKLKSKKA